MARRHGGGFSVLGQSVKEAIVYGLVAHLVFNTWHEILGGINGWGYGYSVVGLVSFLIDQVLPAEWVPLLVVVLLLVVTVFLGFKFLPLIRGAFDRPLHTVLVALLVFGVTIGLFEVVYFGWTGGELFFSPHLIYNVVPPLVVATVIIAGRGSRVYLRETGARDTHELESDDDH